MPYKSQKRQLEAMRRWRQKHPTYMREYYHKAVKPMMPVRNAVAWCNGRRVRIAAEVEV